MAGDKKSFLLRLDPRLWDDLQQWSGQELRSVNAQIEYVLKEAVARRKGRATAGPGSREESAQRRATTPS